MHKSRVYNLSMQSVNAYDSKAWEPMCSFVWLFWQAEIVIKCYNSNQLY